MNKVTADRMEKLVSRKGNPERIQELFAWMPVIDSLDPNTRYDITFVSDAMMVGLLGAHVAEAVGDQLNRFIDGGVVEIPTKIEPTPDSVAMALDAVESACLAAYGTRDYNTAFCG